MKDSSGVPAPPKRTVSRLGAFSVLSERDYRFFWIGLVLNVIGLRAEQVGFYWLIWELTHSPLVLGYLGLAQGLPVVVFQLLGGLTADRVHRLRLLIWVQTLSGFVLLTALTLTATGYVRVEHLLVMAALLGIFRAFEEPSRYALVPQLVGREKLPSAIAVGSIPWQSGRIVGPAIAGLTISAFGVAAGLALPVLTCMGTIFFYSRIRPAHVASGEHSPNLLHDLFQGFAFVFREPLFLALIGLTYINSLFGMSYMTLLPVFADHYLLIGSSGYGFLQAVTGVGAVIGSFTVAAMAHRDLDRLRVVLLSACVFGLLLVLFSQTADVAVAAPLLALVGLSNTLYMTTVNTVLQDKVPDHIRGRVMGIFSLCWYLIPVGGFVVGSIAAALDARFAILLGGAIVLVAGPVILGLGRLSRPGL